MCSKGARFVFTVWMNEVNSIKDSAKIVGEAGTPQIPMLLFVSNGTGTGWDIEAWCSYQKDYLDSLGHGDMIELDCPHYVHDYEYETISENIVEFLSR